MADVGHGYNMGRGRRDANHTKVGYGKDPDHTHRNPEYRREHVGSPTGK